MQDIYQKARYWANQRRPQVEHRARSTPGNYLANLATQWRLLLVRDIPL